MTPNPFALNPDTLSVGELAVIEEMTDLELAEILVGIRDGLAARSPQFLLALMFIQGRRSSPDYTVEEAMATPFAAFADLGGDEETDGGE